MFDYSKKYLFIFPHPDDETFSCGGLIQKIINGGGNLRVVILTKGEASTLMRGVNNPENLSKIRSQELNEALNVLKVNNFALYDFSDGKLSEQQNGISEVVKNEVNTYKPSYVVTFEPFGIYGHPDHIILTKIIVDFYSVAKSFKLIYSTIPKNLFLNSSNMSTAQKGVPLEPTYIVKLNFKNYLNKIRALLKHKSQFYFLGNVIHTIYLLIHLRKEYFADN